MWVYTKHGFFSIVQDKDDEGYLIVRARVKGDIEFYFDARQVKETENSDYRYRIRLHREIVNTWLYEAVDDIDYTNFKAAAGMQDNRRSEYYGLIWSIMADMQEDLLLVLDDSSSSEG